MNDKKIFSEEKQSKLVLHTSIEKVTFIGLNMQFFFKTVCIRRKRSITPKYIYKQNSTFHNNVKMFNDNIKHFIYISTQKITY